MALYDTRRPKHVDRRRVYLDSAERDPARSRSRYRASFELPELLEQVVSAELVGFNFARCVVPSVSAAFQPEDGPRVRGNNMLDVRLTDAAEPPTQVLEFSAEVPEGRYANAEELRSVLPGLLEAAMDAEGHPVFNSAGGTSFEAVGDAWDTGTGKAGAAWLFLRALQGGDPALVRMSFLFGSGAHAADSCWDLLGFEEGRDVGGATLGGAVSDPVPVRPVALQRARWVDVSVEELPELRPLARVHLADNAERAAEAYLVWNSASLTPDRDGFRTHAHLQHSPRFLVPSPPRRLRRLTLRLDFEGGVLPLEEFDRDYDLVLEFVVVAPEQGVPCWVNQLFEV
jgi:hypothetical protein